MTGVEILNSYEVLVTVGCNWSALWLTVLFVMVVAISIGISSSIVEADWSLLLVSIVIGLILSIFAGIFIGVVIAGPEQYETRYQVTISDQVYMNEFLDKYEIINQDGKIYTVREKEMTEGQK
jgi:hypothetical protein